ncbi:MAG: hypothetical protein PHV34_03955 [Verrucomicrobiae bacterium]|nr:hypothetical protein [Verrucomicrobiae bacterium]
MKKILCFALILSAIIAFNIYSEDYELTVGTGTNRTVVAVWPCLPEVYELRTAGFSHYGSVDTKIMCTLNVITNSGQGIVYNYVTNTANGATITLLKKCKIDLYGRIYADADGASGLCVFGFSKNSNQLTTTILNINIANLLNCGVCFCGARTGCSWSGVGYSNDVFRVHTHGLTPLIGSECTFGGTFMPLE